MTASTGLRFEVLGPVQVTHGERQWPIRSRRQRAILTVLLLNRGRTVGLDTLADAAWAGPAPPTARNQVHICISAIRKSLNRLGGVGLLRTTPPGYLLDVSAEQVDLELFRDRTGRAAAAADRGDPAAAVALMRQAVALWRGSFGADLENIAFTGTISRLEEELLAAWESYSDLELGLGRPEQLLAGLAEQVERYPFQERLRVRYAEALSRTGRRSEALEVCRAGCRLLGDQLGLPPGAELRALEADLAAPARADASPVRSGIVSRSPVVPPRQTPRDLDDFTGRRGLVEKVEALFVQRAPVVALHGAAGNGKSALAVHVAHRLAERRFRDGQLYIDLRGSTQDPVPQADALRRFIRAFGVPSDAVPRDVDERADLYRSLLAARDVLVVLDDAASEAQIRQLVPGGSRCGVVITARTRLPGLPGPHWAEVGALSDDDALGLLTAVIGRGRVAAEPGAARRLVRLADGQALAVRMLAEQLAARPRRRLAEMLLSMKDPRAAWSTLRLGDRDAFSGIEAEFQALPAEMLRTVLLTAGRAGSADAESLAGALESHRSAAQRIVERLVDGHLLHEVPGGSPGRVHYRVPNLVRTYLYGRTDRTVHQGLMAEQTMRSSDV
ncbi:BTAD domain-containing putative transcriptional regulator [Kitasatospora sp. MAP5-34]|uniref:AfsR/SARP family transcriptional regulator n=1 Tax=Kitasatospora sp. MAP5-34 TaxID=3035102 RepID=UPI002476F2F3|nr:BTAD domain-containing putative transcriptional regulator [Kitasatospora sp. MAP5-34]MDH6578635.1 DNA-binding SARP family transcriptional activator [Kitasatospora sp. MAP5-34]